MTTSARLLAPHLLRSILFIRQPRSPRNKGFTPSRPEAPRENRLHSGIGYVTPDDEHAGRGEAIRTARRQGLHDAAQRRLAHHRRQRKNQNHNHRSDPQGVD